MAETDSRAEPAEERAARLKERVYLTFTALAVVLALRSHGGEALEAAVLLLITVTGTLLAVLVADVVSHIAVHAALPDRERVGRMLRVSFGALGAVTLPFVFLGLAVAGVWKIEGALRASTIALVAGLAAISYLAVRRVRLPGWQRLIVLGAELVLGAAVVGLELLAHG
ncbi:hypothetical protein [Actinokineospora globicatena]|uniref:Uncharacterized protein n=1 Tax=Actinokineospora globicatena TaxID=103729 RepID=A0A9W6QML2_9PSEU|nr:hypothetical protein [Actinokineospora globicatena]MCP2304142.1 hypothetical protein [Actinokineospora globicatena]GLW78503.1 hypothetical protein Aglo01_29850 [Actinokineospora globicatena]GLW84833.1 hypothetical protein Aglo02_24730 [Actinokineospora globicatena]GLW91108.1 hypothetical protein Aglo03_19240 [Actinokineospora globicatena]